MPAIVFVGDGTTVEEWRFVVECLVDGPRWRPRAKFTSRTDADLYKRSLERSGCLGTRVVEVVARREDAR